MSSSLFRISQNSVGRKPKSHEPGRELVFQRQTSLPTLCWRPVLRSFLEFNWMLALASWSLFAQGLSAKEEAPRLPGLPTPAPSSLLSVASGSTEAGPQGHHGTGLCDWLEPYCCGCQAAGSIHVATMRSDVPKVYQPHLNLCR